MVSLRDFLISTGQNDSEVSILEVAEHCQVESPISLRALIEGGCQQTFAVALERQEIGVIPDEGIIPPYRGRLFASGILEAIAVPAAAGLSHVAFVKVGHSTNECNDPEAVVTVPGGTGIGRDGISEIFDVAEQPSPVDFIACVSSASPLQFVSIDVTISPL